MKSRMELGFDVPMPTEADINRDVDEAYARQRDEFCVASIINKAKEKQ